MRAAISRLIHGAVAAAAVSALLAGCAALGGAPARANLLTYIAMLGLAAAVEAAASSAAPATAPGRASDRMANAAAGLALLVASCLLAAWPAERPLLSIFGVAGVAAMAAGGLLRAAAISRLGARFSSENAVVPGARLEQDGVYRWLAHPSEVGLLLLGGGAVLLVGGGLAVVAWLVFQAGTLLRLALEERALARVFGDEYRRYRAATLDPRGFAEGKR